MATYICPLSYICSVPDPKGCHTISPSAPFPALRCTKQSRLRDLLRLSLLHIACACGARIPVEIGNYPIVQPTSPPPCTPDTPPPSPGHGTSTDAHGINKFLPLRRARGSVPIRPLAKLERDDEWTSQTRLCRMEVYQGNGPPVSLSYGMYVFT